MNAAERLALIRARVKSAGSIQGYKPAGLYCEAKGLPPTPKRKMGSPKLWKTRHRGRGVYDTGYSPKLMADAPTWLYCPVKKVPEHCRIKRKKRVSPLTKIAKAWDDPETFRPRCPQI